MVDLLVVVQELMVVLFQRYLSTGKEGYLQG